MKNRKKILVSFSGGLDSTYLVYDNLKKGYHVNGLYSTIENNPNKVLVETTQICKMSKLFKKEFDHHFDLRYGVTIQINKHNHLTLNQTPVWLISLLYAYDGEDEIHVGAVMNDDMLSHLDDIQKIWNSYRWLSPKLPPLKFPLRKIHKRDIVRNLPEQYRELVTYCESPRIIEKEPDLVYGKCGYCHACLRYDYDQNVIRMPYGQLEPKDLSKTHTELLTPVPYENRI